MRNRRGGRGKQKGALLAAPLRRRLLFRVLLGLPQNWGRGGQALVAFQILPYTDEAGALYQSVCTPSG